MIDTSLSTTPSSVKTIARVTNGLHTDDKPTYYYEHIVLQEENGIWRWRCKCHSKFKPMDPSIGNVNQHVKKCQCEALSAPRRLF